MENALETVHNLDSSDDGSLKYKILPHNLEAEQGLLGALLIDNKALDQISDFLQADHFFVPAHSRIYEAIVHMIDRGELASPVRLKNYFENDDDLKDVGGAKYLADLAGSIISVVNVKDYANTIFDLHLARSLILKCQETTAKAFETNIQQNTSELIEEHETALFSLAESGVSQNDAVSFRDSIQGAITLADKAFNMDGHVPGVTTGLTDLDNILGGLHCTDLLILAGRPSMGKTALATNIAFNAAKNFMESGGRAGAKVALFSLEMGHAQIASRILADLSNVSSDAIRKGKIKAEDFQRFTQVSQQYHDLPLFTDDTAGLTISALRTRARRLKRKYDIGLLVVDYLQLLSGSNKGYSRENRNQEISEITRGLKTIAKDLNIPVLALSQLSRQVEHREDKRPQLSDLRESGSIEQDSDVVMFVYREEYYLSREEPMQKASETIDQFQQRKQTWQQAIDSSQNITEVIVSKQRHGPIGAAKLFFDPNYTRFRDLDQKY